MKEFELPILINLIANPYAVGRTAEAVIIVKAKTRRQALKIAISYPHFKAFAV